MTHDAVELNCGPELLRSQAHNRGDKGYDTQLMFAAADEIERLQTTLRTIAESDDPSRANYRSDAEVRRMAKAAVQLQPCCGQLNPDLCPHYVSDLEWS